MESYNDWRDTDWYREHESSNATVLYPESCCDDGVCDYDESPMNDTALNKKVSGWQSCKTIEGIKYFIVFNTPIVLEHLFDMFVV